MTGTDSDVDAQNSDFVLKHRVVGAAVILFFGALVLPWLLGAPSEARKNADAQTISENQQELAIDQELREELLASLEAEQELPADQVYISKITPLSRLEDANPAPQNRPQQKPEQKPVPESTQAVAPITKPTDKKVEDKTVEESKPITKPPVETKPEPAAPEKEAAEPAEQVAASKPVSVGWIVQVGVFTDKNGVARVLQDLRDKGFTPSTTIVDTNRGKNTGTRIWLGPFEQRVQAAQMISQLSDKTGEAGFIRAYP